MKCYQLYLGKDETGKRIVRNFYGHTKTEARRKAEDFRRQKKESQELFKTIAEAFLGDNPDTTKKIRIEFFSPYLGKKIKDIQVSDIEKALNVLAKENPRTGKPTSFRTLTRYLQSLNSVFVYAQRNRIIDFNPCEFVRVPKSTPPHEREALTPEQREKIDSCSSLACKIMMYCGLRRGELTALQWDDIDIKSKVIKVTKSYDYKNGELKPPKTRSGIRCVPVPKTLLKSLISHSKGYVVTNSQGEMMTEASWNNHLKKIVKEVGFKFSYHQLRHTYATILYSAGVDPLTAQHLLGHSDVKTTMSIYTHLDEQKKISSIEKLDNYLTG